MGRFILSRAVLSDFKHRIIVISALEVSFLFPERDSRLPAFTGPASACNWELPQLLPLGKYRQSRCRSRALCIFSLVHKSIMPLFNIRSLFPHRWISSSFHQYSFCDCNYATPRLQNGIRRHFTLSQSYSFPFLSG